MQYVRSRIAQILEARDTSAADHFIKDWSYDSQYAKAKKGVRMGFRSAYAAYPYKGNDTLYRGLTFKAKKQYEQFVAALSLTGNVGVLREHYLSSWSTYIEQASAFALLDDEYDEIVHAKLLLSAKPPSGARMVDAAECEHGDNEIIIEPATFNVTIVKQWVDGIG